MNFPKLHKALLEWFDREKRALPWRESKDPYRIWLSEIMLQQTRVEAVLPYYGRFLSHFPTVQDLAAAPLDSVLNLWAGLGYYSRARNLKAAAETVVNEHDGKFPRTAESLLSLKGVGAYTAAAVASIAFGEKVPAVDGNLERVISRLLALRKNPKMDGKKEVYDFGYDLVQEGRAGDVNEAFMDLSASICLPKEPKCAECPLSRFCESRRQGIQRELPVRAEKKAKRELNAKGLVVMAEDSLLLARRPKGEWLAGLWDIPWWIETPESRPISLPELGETIGTCAQKRTITNHKIHFFVQAICAEKKLSERRLKQVPAPTEEFRWVRLEDLHGFHLPRPTEKALSALLREKITPKSADLS